MITLLPRQRLALNRTGARTVLAPIDLDVQTSHLEVRIARPTSFVSRAWGNADRIAVDIVVEVNGQEYRCSGSATGGIVVSRFGKEHPNYVVRYGLPCGFLRDKSGFPVKLGEIATGPYRVRVEVSSLSGQIDSEVEVVSDAFAAPKIAFHSSVAFDAATDASETGGDGVISLTHTATGSNLAAFAGVANTNGTVRNLSSVTYDGSAMTELWDDVFSTFYQNGGAALAGIPTGAKTVTATMSGSIGDYLNLAVISMTGVDQTTPVGTAVGAQGDSTTATTTVTGVGSDDLVVSNLATAWNGATEGAAQTERSEEIVGAEWTMQTTTQLGSDGGVMSCTRTAAGPISNVWRIVGVAFKPAAGGGGLVGPLLRGRTIRRGALGGVLVK